MSRQLDRKAEYAYTAGMQAFIYGFPYIHNAKLRHDWVTQARDPAVVPARPAATANRTGCPSARHPWFVILRLYRPRPAVTEAKWECPGITPVT